MKMEEFQILFWFNKYFMKTLEIRNASGVSGGQMKTMKHKGQELGKFSIDS